MLSTKQMTWFEIAVLTLAFPFVAIYLLVANFRQVYRFTRIAILSVPAIFVFLGLCAVEMFDENLARRIGNIMPEVDIDAR